MTRNSREGLSLQLIVAGAAPAEDHRQGCGGDAANRSRRQLCDLHARHCGPPHRGDPVHPDRRADHPVPGEGVRAARHHARLRAGPAVTRRDGSALSGERPDGTEPSFFHFFFSNLLDFRKFSRYINLYRIKIHGGGTVFSLNILY